VRIARTVAAARRPPPAAVAHPQTAQRVRSRCSRTGDREQYYEAIVGTLKAAKKKGFIEWKGQILMKGAHDDVDITLLVEPWV
jgi:hypothetical protein